MSDLILYVAGDELPMKSFFSLPKVEASFWQMLGAVLFFVSPLVMIMAATELGGTFLRVIRDTFSNINRHDKHDDYDDDGRD